MPLPAMEEAIFLVLLMKMKNCKFEKITEKQTDILQFIRVALLRPEQMDAILPQMVQHAMHTHKNTVTIEEVQNLAKNRILSDEHLSQFIPMIEEIFSHEEIKRLIQFYQDQSIEKYFKNGAVIGPTIYSSFGRVVGSILADDPSS